MISFSIGLIAFLLLFSFFGLFKKENWLNDSRDSDFPFKLSSIFKLAGCILVFIITSLLNPIEIQRIDAGAIGLKIDRVGNDKGIPIARPVKGWILYNSFTTDVEEVSIRQFSVKYKEFEVPAKGGVMIPVSPEFNLSLKPEMYEHLYIHVLKGGDLESLTETWIKKGTINAMVYGTNKFTPDSIFNYAEIYRNEIEHQLASQLGKYFNVDQTNAGQHPPKSMKEALQKQADAVLQTRQAELNRQAADAEAYTKIAIARGDSSAKVINAAADALAIKLKTKELSPQYVDYVKWSTASPENPRVPQYMLGTNTSMFLQK